MPDPITRANSNTGQLEILHPELQIWVQGVAALIVAGGFTVNLQDAQALLLSTIASKVAFLQPSDEKLSAVRAALESLNLKVGDLQDQVRSISLDKLPSIVTTVQGASQEIETSGNDLLASISQVSSKIPSIGQKVKAGSVSFVLASDHQSIPVSLGAQGLLDFTVNGTASFGIIKAAPGSIHCFSCTNSSEEMRWLQLFDRVNSPASGAFAKKTYPVHPSEGHLVRDANFFGNAGLSFPTGIAWAFSTNRLIFTAPPINTECIFEATYV